MTGSTAGRRPRLVHLTTTDMSLDWLLGPQLRAFADAGYEVIGMSAPGPHVPDLEAWGVRHVSVPALTRASDPRNDVRAFTQLVGRMRELRPDIVHTHNPKPGILGRIAARLTRVPLIVNTQHGLYAQPDDRRRRRWPVYAVERVAAAFGDVELVQNIEDLATLRDRLHVPDGRLVLLGNGIDLARFSPDAVPVGARDEVRSGWGIEPRGVAIGTVARLVAEKGIRELFAAMRIVRGNHPDATLVVIGPTELGKGDAINAEEVSAARRDGVVLAGRRDDMPACYSALDVFVTASWREGFPRAAMEAAAMGLPTVGTDIRGTRQVVADGTTGRLVRPRSPDELAAAIDELAADADLRQAWGGAARRRALDEFDQQQVIDRTLAAYRRPPARARAR